MKGIANGDNSNFKIGGMSEASAGEEGAGDDHDHDEDGGNYMGEQVNGGTVFSNNMGCIK